LPSTADDLSAYQRTFFSWNIRYLCGFPDILPSRGSVRVNTVSTFASSAKEGHLVPSGGKARKHEQVIAALLSTPTIGEAAERAGLGVRTVKRWMRDADFAAEYTAAKQALLESAVNRLRTAALAFVDVLHSVALDATAPAGSRAAAAGRGLELLLKATAFADIERRLAELERSVAKGDD
jgi:hypothetical protein